MNVIDIMTAKPVTIHQDKSLRHALELMDQQGCRHLPVLDSLGHLVGVLSDRDCRKALNQPELLPEHWQSDALSNQIAVRRLMTPAPIIIEPTNSAGDAARLMLINHISCLPVMRSETLVGIITKSDLLIAFMKLYNEFRHVRDA
jgi:acetoin utilization protein AcuB